MKKVGFIGTGIMGKSMCKHILNSHYSLSVFNRSQKKADELIQLGAKFKSPEDIASESDAVFLMVGAPSDVEGITLGNKGIINFMKSGSILVDHTTSSPNLAQKIYQVCKAKGIHSIDAPVSGGDGGAREGKLVVMAGGDQEAFKEISPVLRTYSQKMTLFGKAGSGQHVKMVNQTMICTKMLGVVEGLLYGYRAGLDLQKVIELISGGAAGSYSLSVVAPKILKGDFEPGIYVDHFVKDLGIVLDEAKKMQLYLPGVSLATQLYNLLQNQGSGKLSYAALIKVLEKLNNLDMSLPNNKFV